MQAAAGAAARRESADAWRVAVRSSVLLRKLPPETVSYLLRSSKQERKAAGETIVSAGDLATHWYVVQSGRYCATMAGSDGTTPQTVREYGPSDTFGGSALLHDGPHSVTITALDGGALWVFSKKVFDAKIKHGPAPPPTLVDRVRMVPDFDGMPHSDHVQLCRALTEVTLEKGASLYRQGEPAKSLYALCDGQLKRVRDGDEANKTILRQEASVSGPFGPLLGTAALLANDADRVYSEDLTAWGRRASLMRFDVSDVETLVGYELLRHAAREQKLEALASVKLHDKPVLDVGALGVAERAWLGDALMHERPYSRGEPIVLEGDLDAKLYCILRGACSVHTEHHGQVAQLGAGQFFGELALTGRKHKRGVGIAALGCDDGGPTPVCSLCRWRLCAGMRR